MTNLLAYGVQLSVVVAAGATIAWASRLRAPRIMLAYWQTLLAVCLLLPAIQPWHRSIAPFGDPPAAVATAGAVEVSAPPPGPPESTVPSAASVALFVLLGGMALRLCWLGTGAVRLWRLRRTARLIVPPPDAFLVAADRLGVHANVYVSDRLSGPVTFGVRRAVVLLTPGVLDMPSHVQEAIASHELLHVRRRDCVYELVEEGIRTLFWYHPAVWWLIGRIQLSREQVVDQAAIHLTKSRERYLDALLIVALTKSPRTFLPAPLFLRRSLLKKRVAQILQETTMTTRRLVASLAAGAATLVLVTAMTVRSFPLEAQTPPGPNSGEPIQIVGGADHLLHGSLPEYPRRAIENRIEGDVLLELVVDDRGEVSDARVISGPDELRRAALESVLQWHYSRAALTSPGLQATLRFRLPPPNAEYEGRRFGFAFKVEDDKQELTSALRVEHAIAELLRALEDPGASEAQKLEWRSRLAEQQQILEHIRAEREIARPAALDGSLKLVQIRTERVTRETVSELVARAGISIGDQIAEDTAKRIVETAATIDEHLRVNFRKDGKGGVILTLLNP
jgi:bla regulator protein blaR1